jgi:dTDP-4-dehydrorhamnose 3,5-epimerase-like enzyme
MVFLVREGTELYLENLQTKGKLCLKLSTKKPKVITIFPKTAHAVKNTSKEIIYLISAENTIYNPKKSRHL